ncbi:vWA domain-containing protein [Rubrimonas cliftonensis]|uniref:von Willebrand factor type A domain-containing protein n=1 Tax=Rubrimonas cliftonensis TaxID=89524 RepID=A0A1H3VF16_9RHOB|nr:VWA domain-containing protein [Rubrimonas cliftonensis]SDZ73356.1 von Willebrand factor type A domain-containing protein [Rubrimonas cliftonensis]
MPASRVTSETPWHVVFVIDDSHSMSGPPADAVNESLKHLLAQLEMSSQGKKPYFKVSIIAFGSSVQPICEAAAETDVDADAIATFGGNLGGTDAAAAFDETAALLRRHPGKASDFTPFVFFFSDGAPADDKLALAAAEKVKNLDIPAGKPWIVSIGLGDGVQEDFMKSAATTSELYKWLRTPADIVKFLPAIGTVAQTTAGGAEGVAAGVMQF